MRPLLACSGLLLVLACLPHGRADAAAGAYSFAADDSQFGGPAEEEPEVHEVPGAEDEQDYGEPFWTDLPARMQRAWDRDSLLRARRWGNIANGALLGATGPVTFIVSVLSLRLPNAVLSVYLTLLGGSLTALELGLSPVAPWISSHLSYLSTSNGHTALLTIAGGLAWAFGKAGLLTALVTCANALFNANFGRVLDFVEQDDESCDAPEADPLGTARLAHDGSADDASAEQGMPEAEAEAEAEPLKADGAETKESASAAALQAELVAQLLARRRLEAEAEEAAGAAPAEAAPEAAEADGM